MRNAGKLIFTAPAGQLIWLLPSKALRIWPCCSRASGNQESLVAAQRQTVRMRSRRSQRSRRSLRTQVASVIANVQHRLSAACHLTAASLAASLALAKATPRHHASLERKEGGCLLCTDPALEGQGRKSAAMTSWLLIFWASPGRGCPAWRGFQERATGGARPPRRRISRLQRPSTASMASSRNCCGLPVRSSTSSSVLKLLGLQRWPVTPVRHLLRCLLAVH